MKIRLLALLFAASFAIAEGDEPAATDEAAPDPEAVLVKLEKANDEKDSFGVDRMIPEIVASAKGADEKMRDKLAKELAKSLKISKGNWGTLKKIVEGLGELRSKDGIRAISRIAYQDDAEEGDEQELQAYALVAIGKIGDKRQIGKLEDMAKERNDVVAAAAYEAFKYYGDAKGRTRKKVAEILMKRIEAEYPYSTGSGKSVSNAQVERWKKISPTIVDALRSVCHQKTLNSIDNWREWWAENEDNRDAWRDPK